MGPLTFDAGTLARGWLSVSLASSDDDSAPIIDGTLLIEDYDDGIRLSATDRYMVLTSWIPALANGDFEERALDEAPNGATVVRDVDGRGKALLSYLRKLAAKAAKDEVPLPQITLHLDQAVEEGSEAGFPGMELRQVVLDYEDHEKLALPIIAGQYPAYRTLLLGHQPKSTKKIALNGEFLARVGQIGKILGGYARCTFSGETGMVALEIDNAVLLPNVTGGLMPVKVADIEAVAS